LKRFWKGSELILHQLWGESFFEAPFHFFSSTPFGAIFNRPKMRTLEFRKKIQFIYIYIESKKHISVNSIMKFAYDDMAYTLVDNTFNHLFFTVESSNWGRLVDCISISIFLWGNCQTYLSGHILPPPPPTPICMIISWSW
jgi:hypothetical protein